MGDSAHTTHHTNPGKKSAPPLFLEVDNIFKISATLVPRGMANKMVPTWPIFEKILIFEKKGGC
jgi:hypothetical protein